MMTWFIYAVRSVVLGLIGLAVEAYWRALMQSKPMHWMVHRLLGEIAPFDEETLKRIRRHHRQRRILMLFVPLGMFWIYALGLGSGFDFINWVGRMAPTFGWRLLVQGLMYAPGVWLVEIVVGSVVRIRRTRDMPDGTPAGSWRPRWWDYAEDGYWVINGRRYVTHWRGLIRFDLAPAWIAVGFLFEIARRVIDLTAPTFAHACIYVTQHLWHRVLTLF